MSIDDIIGNFKTIEKLGDLPFYNEFLLKIYKENDKIKFEFKMTTNGEFGIVGKTWLGIGIFRFPHLSLIIEKEKDWIFDEEKNETVTYERNKKEALPVEIYTGDNSYVVIYHKVIDRLITLYKQKSMPS